MARRGLARIVAGSALALLVAFAACAGNNNATPGDAGSDAGAAGTGGTGGSAAGTGGSSGIGGAAGSAGTAATTVWKALPDKVAGCTVERLQNPGDLRAFTWKPCDFSADCEEAEWSIETGLGMGRTSSVHDDGAQARLGLDFLWNTAIFSDEEGHVVDGFHVPESEPCHVESASVFGDREAVALKGKTATNPKGAGGVLATAGGTATSFTLDYGQYPQLVPGYSQNYPLGATRWLWWYGGSDEYLSVSASDGGDARAIGGHSSTMLALSYRSTSGSLFLFDAWYTADQVTAHEAIYSSDGLADPKPYVVPTDGSDYGDVAFANDYVGWLRGNGFVDVGVYKTTEVWAAKWDPDPSKLVPFKVMDDAAPAFPENAGGWGHMALAEYASPTDQQHEQIIIYDLAQKTRRSYPLPSDRHYRAFPGITRKYAYVAAAVLGEGGYRYFMRFKL